MKLHMSLPIHICDILLPATMLCAIAAPAAAYVGPGPGLSMVGSFFTLIASIVVALLMVLLLPMRIMYKRMKLRQNAAAVTNPPEADNLPKDR